jgi:hypothetical protein
MSGEVLHIKDQITHPSGKILCWDCDKPIQRNVAITEDGRPHHFGCLKKDHAKPAFHCLACGAELTRSQVGRVYVEGVLERACSLCGRVGIVEPIGNYTRSFQGALR